MSRGARRMAKMFVGVALVSAVSAAPAQAGPVGEAMCDMASSTCTIYGRADTVLCLFSAPICHL